MSTPTATSEQAASRGLTIRSVLLGIALIVANAYWLNDATWGGKILHAYKSLFANAVFCLFVLTLINLAIKRALPRYALTSAEMFVVYVMVVMVSTLSGNTNMGYMIFLLAHPVWFATPENDWARLFGTFIPDWFTVHDERVLREFYEGESSFFSPHNLRAWAGPMVVWSSFVLVLYGVLLCMNAVLRRQFTDHERLTYPITHMPLALGREPERFFRLRSLWIGLGIAVGIQLWNGIQFLHPVLPRIPIGIFNITHLLREKPWDVLGTTLFSVGPPSVVGLAFLMPLDMAFSSWFFFVGGKLMLVGASALGLRANLYQDQQAMGAWVGLAILTLWIARRHLARVFRHIIGTGPPLNDRDEPMRYRLAGVGIVLGCVLIVSFGVKAGAAVWTMVGFFAIYFLMAISITKVRAGLGPPVHETIYKDPGSMMTGMFGSRMIGARSLTILSFFYWLNRVNPAHPMPNQMEAYHIGRQSGVPRNRLLTAIIIALVVGVPVTFITYLAMTYDRGGIGAIHTTNPMGEPFRFLQGRLALPSDPDGMAIGAMAGGFGVTMFLTAMKLRFLWWPFHPIGFVIGTGRYGDMFFFWFTIMVTWLIKLTILKYGGFQAYRRAVPLFAGLLIGDYASGCCWSLISIATGIPMYQSI